MRRAFFIVLAIMALFVTACGAPQAEESVIQPAEPVRYPCASLEAHAGSGAHADSHTLFPLRPNGGYVLC